MDGGERLRRSVMTHLLKDSSLRIMAACTSVDRSPLEITRLLGLPVASTYRLIGLLENAGLLVCTGEKENNRGRKVRLYRSRIEELVLSLRDEEFSISYVEGPGADTTQTRFAIEDPEGLFVA